jgi:hypothetical protein
MTLACCKSQFVSLQISRFAGGGQDAGEKPQGSADCALRYRRTGHVAPDYSRGGW